MPCGMLEQKLSMPHARNGGLGCVTRKRSTTKSRGSTFKLENPSTAPGLRPPSAPTPGVSLTPMQKMNYGTLIRIGTTMRSSFVAMNGAANLRDSPHPMLGAAALLSPCPAGPDGKTSTQKSADPRETGGARSEERRVGKE